MTPAPTPAAVVPANMTASEWQARIDLAAACRLTALMGWTDLLASHISVLVPGRVDQYLINPYGMLFEEITASDIVKVDNDGNILSETPHIIGTGGFAIHSAIHRSRPEFKCVFHTHTTAGVGIASQKKGLLPVTQMALVILPMVRYHDFEGFASLDERDRLVQHLGDGRIMILRNHGLLTVGETIAEAFAHMYRIDRACRMQLAAQTGTASAELNELPQAVIDKSYQQAEKILGKDGWLPGGKREWAALVRKLDRDDPGYQV